MERRLAISKGRGCATALLGLVAALGCTAEPELSDAPAVPTAPAADHHLHIRSPEGAQHLDRVNRLLDEPGSEADSPPLTASDALTALDAAGIERGLVFSIAYMYGMPDLTVEEEYAQVMAENDYVASEVALHPKRLVGFCSVNPLKDYALEEVERCAADNRLVGLKLHLANSDVDLRDDQHVERLAGLFRLLERLGLPVAAHMRTRREDYGEEDARIFIDAVLAPALEVPVQIAHAAGWGGYDGATDSALSAFVEAFEDGRLDRERITFDLAAVVFQPEAAGADTALARQVREANARLADRIREIGVDRFVYATDWPGWPPVPDVRARVGANVSLVRSALPLTEWELERIFTNTGPAARPR